jgi:GDP-L-fucose synthase
VKHPSNLNSQHKIYIAGHRGLAGSAIHRSLVSQGYNNLVLRTHQELDLRNQAATQAFFVKEKPEIVFLSAAKVGGILANDKYRGDFILENLQIQTNVISSAFVTGVQKLVFLGSSCIYPKFAKQPIAESELLTGPLEPTNDAYAIAKIAGLMLCQSLMRQYGRSFISLMPTNLYGPGDNYDLDNSHVLPALIRKFHEAKTSKSPTVTCWGSGTPQREFMYSEDLGDAVVFCARHYNQPEHINIGSEQELTIKELAELVSEIVGFTGKIVWDSTKPDGTPRKRMDSSKLHALGWKPKFTLKQGIALSYTDFLSRN